MNRQRVSYGELHEDVSRFIGISDTVLSSSMSEMESHFAGGVVPYTDGYIQGLLLWADTMLNIASSHLAIAFTVREERRSSVSDERIVAGDFALTDCNVNDSMSLILPLLPKHALKIVKQVPNNHQRVLRCQLDWEKT